MTGQRSLTPFNLTSHNAPARPEDACCWLPNTLTQQHVNQERVQSPCPGCTGDSNSYCQLAYCHLHATACFAMLSSTWEDDSLTRNRLKLITYLLHQSCCPLSIFFALNKAGSGSTGQCARITTSYTCKLLGT